MRQAWVFLDTEFSSFEDPRLISAGLASETGATCHVALEAAEGGWQPHSCSAFVRNVVLPLVDTPALPRAAARDAVIAFLRAQMTGTGPPLIVTDFTGDWVLLSDLIAPLPEDLAGMEARLFTSPRIDYYPWNGRRHHALVDAQALLWAWREEEAAASA